MAEYQLTKEEMENIIPGNAASQNKMTPRRAIRKNCIDCIGGATEVRDCQGDKLFDRPCLFYPYRMGRGRPSVRLIRKNCLWCRGGSAPLVRNCPSKTCLFLPYRMGKSPAHAGLPGRFKSGVRPRHEGNSPLESINIGG